MVSLASLFRSPRSIFAFALALSSSAGAAEFYEGKTIDFFVAAPAGGGFDLLARIAARHLPKYIAGSPTFVIKNLPAAAGLAGAYHIAKVAPGDGTAIGLLQRSVLLSHITNPGGVRFNLGDFNWIANLGSETSVAIAWGQSPVKSSRDLMSIGMTVGGLTAGDPELTAKLYNGLIGAKLRIVNGYDGTTSIALAMERGEIDGTADWSWSSLKSQRPEWLRDHKINVLMQGALTPDPELPNVPNALDFVDDPVKSAAMRLYFEQKVLARPIVTPARIPAAQRLQLENAFAALGSDRAFLDDILRAKLETNVTVGEEVEREVAKIQSAPVAVLQILGEALALK